MYHLRLTELLIISESSMSQSTCDTEVRMNIAEFHGTLPHTYVLVQMSNNGIFFVFKKMIFGFYQLQIK